MATVPEIIASLNASTTRADTASTQMYGVANGPASGPGSTVATDSGAVPTLAKFLADNQTSIDDQANLAARLADPTSAARGGGLVGVQSGIAYPPGSTGERFKDEIAITEPRFGGQQSGSWNAAFAAAKTDADSKDNPGDANGPYAGPELTIPNAAFPISADVAMPRRVRSLGNLTGAFRAVWTQIKRAVVNDLTAAGAMRFDGVWFSRIGGLQGNVDVKGGGVGFGTFWNTFQNIVGDVSIDVSNWSVNQNIFVQGRGKVTISGGPSGALDCHQNVFLCWDFTPGAVGYLDTSSTQQTNLIIAGYWEAGATVKGPVHLFGFHGDDDGPPRIGRDNWAIGSTNVIERNRADFIPAGSRSILQGGEWDFLDAAGKPPCLASSGGTTVAADATEPFGMKYKFGGAFSLPFTGFQITIPPCLSGRFSLALGYQGDDFAAIEVARGGGGTTTSGGGSVSVIDAVNNWKLLRLSGNASQTAYTTVTLFAFQATGGTKTISIGGMFATQEKAAFLPSAQTVREQQGTASQAYTSTGAFVDIPVTFPRPFAAGTTPVVVVTVVNTAAQTPNMTKVFVQAVSNTGFTIRVYFTTDWAGQVNWNARGLD